MTCVSVWIWPYHTGGSRIFDHIFVDCRAQWLSGPMGCPTQIWKAETKLCPTMFLLFWQCPINKCGSKSVQKRLIYLTICRCRTLNKNGPPLSKITKSPPNHAAPCCRQCSMSSWPISMSLDPTERWEVCLHHHVGQFLMKWVHLPWNETKGGV